MKRCPQCQFIYLNSDEWCDFDQTPLVSIDDETVEAAISTNSTKSSAPTAGSTVLSRRLPQLIVVLASAFLLIVGLGFATVYLVMKARANGATVNQVRPVPLPVIEKPSLSPVVSTTIVEPTPEPPPKTVPTPNHTTVSKAAVSIGPVSTSGMSTNGRSGGKPVILLTSGGKIEADQVWRAKEGVWYRRDGIVTLLKRERVRAIVGQ
jgi:hypothetical protein